MADSLTDLTKDADRAGDKIGDSLTDSAKNADKAGDKIEKSFDTTFKSAGKDADKFETKVSDAFKDLARNAKKNADDVGDSFKKGTDKAGEGVEELRDEAKSTAKEAAASFGSVEDALDAVQEIAANALAGFGPAGLAAGAIAAVGIGLATTAMQGNAEKATQLQQQIADMATELASVGGDLSKLDIGGKISDWGKEVQDDNWITFWADESKTNFQDVAEQAEKAGVTARDAIRGQKGSLEDAQQFLKGTQKKWEELNNTIEQGTYIGADGSQVTNDAAKAAQGQAAALAELRKKAQENIDSTKEAIDVYGIEQDALADTTAGLKQKLEATEAVTDATKDAMTTNLDYLDGVDELNAKLTENGATLDRTTKAGRDNERAVVSQAQAIEAQAAASIDAGVANDVVTATFQQQKNTLVSQVLPAFKGNKAAAEQYITAILKTPGIAKTNVQLTGVNTAKAQIASVQAPGTKVVTLVPDISRVRTAVEGMNWQQTVTLQAKYGPNIRNQTFN